MGFGDGRQKAETRIFSTVFMKIRGGGVTDEFFYKFFETGYV